MQRTGRAARRSESRLSTRVAATRLVLWMAGSAVEKLTALRSPACSRRPPRSSRVAGAVLSAAGRTLAAHRLPKRLLFPDGSWMKWLAQGPDRKMAKKRF